MSTGIAEMVEATPASRDRYVDFLRAASILVVVVGHWTIALIFREDGVIRSTSAIGKSPGLWMATWVCQVMPVFFFVGGYANFVAYRSARSRGGRAAAFVRARLRRLLVPFLVLVAVWTVIQIALHLSGTGAPTGPRIGGLVLLRGMRPPGQTIPFGPLWFLAVYVLVVTVSPLTIRLHERFRWWIPAVMVLGTIAVDVVGLGHQHHGVRYLNVVFVLLLPHQLGHFYGDGTADRWPRWVLAGTALISLGGLHVLTNPWIFEWAGGDRRFAWFPGVGHYPRSMLGTDVEPIANSYPPTVCFMLVGTWLISAALLLRPSLTRWLARPGPWRATIVGNAWIMTLFLWHMTAYLAAIVLLWGFGLGHEHEPSARWWWERPVWIVVPGLILAAIVATVGRFETARRRPSSPTSSPRS